MPLLLGGMLKISRGKSNIVWNLLLQVCRPCGSLMVLHRIILLPLCLSLFDGHGLPNLFLALLHLVLQVLSLSFLAVCIPYTPAHCHC